jgi:hypothetical protein
VMMYSQTVMVKLKEQHAVWSTYSAGKSIGNNQRRRGKVVGPSERIHAPLKVSVGRQHSSSNDIYMCKSKP